MDFPYGKVPLAMLVLAIASGLGLFLTSLSAENQRPDLIYATFTKEHAAAYRPAIERFERENGVKIQLQVVSAQALQSRLQASLQVGAEVPDMVELLDGTMGGFTKGPLEDIGFIDVTDRLKAEGLWDKLVASRYSKWSSRGRLFALPHDVHPVMLVYRKDLCEQLGIDVNQLTTWEAFAKVGRERVTKDLNGDGIPDRYMIDLSADGGDMIRLLVLQRGGGIFDAAGNVSFDDEITARTVVWYIRQVAGKDRIAYAAGWGQNLAQSMKEDLLLFYFCADWRTRQFMTDVPWMKGKFGLMPLPAWEEGGRRTSTWGGTGLAITKQCKRPDLAWKLAMYLYYDSQQLGPRFGDTYILPPLREAWDAPQFDQPEPFYNNVAVGRAFAALADQTPQETSSPYMNQAVGKLNEAYQNALQRYTAQGEDGLLEYTRGELRRCADRVRLTMDRNRFIAAKEGTR